MNLISAEDISKEDLEVLMLEVDTVKYASPIRGKIVATLFFEPSTRTRLSFQAAVAKLGGSTIDLGGAEACSVAKGESFKHTIQTVAELADAIVVRHPKNGSAAEAAKVSKVPVINAGDGYNEHPTQALLDVYTMRYWFPDWWKEKTPLTVCLSGDIKHSRTAHSLITLLRHKNTTVILHDRKENLDYREWPGCLKIQDREKVLGITDVLYLIRPQKERWGCHSEQMNHSCWDNIVESRDLAAMKEDAILMHPLPATHELTEIAEKDKRCVVWQQVQHGLLVRMALLRRILTPIEQLPI